MSNKVLYIIVAVLVLLGIGLYVYNSRETQAPTVDNSQNSTTPANDDTADATPSTPEGTAPDSNGNTPINTGGTFSGEADIMGQVHQVTYDGTAFSPAQLTVKTGDTVVFKNNGSSAFWPASGPHPTHTNYPEFDAKRAVAPGGTYSFIFTKIGTWPYHDHLNSSHTGSITVTQ